MPLEPELTQLYQEYLAALPLSYHQTWALGNLTQHNMSYQSIIVGNEQPQSNSWIVVDEVPLPAAVPVNIPPLQYNNKERTRKEDMSDEDAPEQWYNRKLNQLLSFKNGKQKGLVGLEVECEGKQLFSTPFKWWSCHVDGSLRDTDGHPPQEYVLRIPLDLEELKQALEYLEQKFQEAGSSVIKSNRTSVHVHINCQALSLRELYCFILLYIIFEEVLVDWVGPERAGNLFCLRAKDSEFYISMLESVLKTKSFKQWRDEYRYSSCNVASILKFGSLEFRSMPGTIDTNTIYIWASLLVMLKDVASKFDNPVQMVEEFVNIGPLPFFKKIFKDDKFRSLVENQPGLSGKLWDGLRMVRDVAYCCEWLPVSKKKRQPRKKAQAATAASVVA